MQTLVFSLLGILFFFMGASIFSFLNVVIYRVPRHMDFVNDRSICPKCGKQLRAIDMMPVFSWLFLRGKCHYCGEPISPRYPAVELLGGICGILCAWQFGLDVRAILAFLFLCVLTIVAFVDYDTMEIPNGFVLCALVLGIAAIFCFPEVTLVERLIGVAAVSVPMLLLTLAISGAFGGGDIKLMAACGLFLGWKLTLLSTFLAILGGGAYGAYLLLAKKKGKKEHFAFGPFLCMGMAAALFVGNALLGWYLHLLY